MPALDPFPWFDAFVIIGLIFVNGIFAMSELAIVSARTARLKAMAKDGSKGAATAIRLAADPGKFLSTVQIGITLIGIVAGAYSGASLGGPVGERLARLGMDAGLAQTVGFALVIGVTTFASLVIGELVPKQIALRAGERIAATMAIPMDLMARIMAPIVWLLDSTGALLLRMIGMKRSTGDLVTAEELHMIFAEATRSGVIEENERAIISGVVRLADRPVREVMTPRTEVDWIDVSASEEEIRERLDTTSHNRLPVADGSVDNILGVVQVREIMMRIMDGEPVDLRQMMRRVEIVPDQVDAMDALRVLQQGEISMALVHDEYGHFDGLVTPADLLSAIAGQFAEDQDDGELPQMIERSDGSYLLSGALPADTLAEQLGLDLPDDRDYATVAGYALNVLRRLPVEGESFTDQDFVFEIIDMDGRKIDKLIVTRKRWQD